MLLIILNNLKEFGLNINIFTLRKVIKKDLILQFKAPCSLACGLLLVGKLFIFTFFSKGNIPAQICRWLKCAK